MFKSQTTTKVIAERTAMAPKVPQKIAFLCKFGGRFRAASAITIALSPASTRSINIIAPSADQNSGLNSSIKGPLRCQKVNTKVLPTWSELSLSAIYDLFAGLDLSLHFTRKHRDCEQSVLTMRTRMDVVSIYAPPLATPQGKWKVTSACALVNLSWTSGGSTNGD